MSNYIRGEPPDGETSPATAAQLWALLEQTKAGRMEAYGELYDRTVEQVKTYLASRLTDHHLVEDITSAAFETLLRRIQTVTRRADSPVAYLIRVAQNLATDHQRRHETRFAVPMADLSEALAGRLPAADLGGQVPEAAGEDALVLWGSVDRLPADQQAVLRYRFALDRSISDTATAMERSTDAVRSLQCRAVRNLAQDADVRSLN